MKSFILLIMFTSVFSCKQRTENTVSSDDKSDLAGFFSIDSIKLPTKFSDLKEKKDLESALKGLDLRFALEPRRDKSEEESLGWSQKCMDRLSKKWLLVADKESVSIKVDEILNKENCLEEYEARDKSNDDGFDSYLVKMFGELKCESIDLSKFNGMTFLNNETSEPIEILRACRQGQRISKISQTKIEMDLDIVSDGLKVSGKYLQEEGELMEDTKPCIWTVNNDIWTTKECMVFKLLDSKDIMVNGKKFDEKANTTYAKATLNGLSGKSGQQYYLNGESNLTVNDWKGKAKFDGTKNLAWSLKRKDITQEGSFEL